MNRQEIESKIVTFSNGVKVINTTPHDCTFQDGEELVVVPPCGFLLNAEIENEIVEYAGLVKFVTPVFGEDQEGLNFLDWMEEEFSNVYIVGSIIAARAYPERCVAMIPAEGFERVPPAQKRMRIDCFAVYPPDSFDHPF